MAQQNNFAVLMMWKDEQMIKAITGDPGSGKTALLAEYQQYLRTTGVPDDRIVSINFGTLKLLPNYHVLHECIKARLDSNDTTYILLDEVQLVPGFEKVVASLFAKPNVDIYISGNKAQLLGGKDATLLSGRYVEIHMEP